MNIEKDQGLEGAFAVSTFGAEALPLVLSPRDGARSREELLARIEAHRSSLRAALHRHGGVLLRGFAMGEASHFADAVQALSTGPSLDYIGGDSPRTKVHGAVYTSTEAPPSLKIPLHNELSFVRKHPRHIFFFCETAPAAQGETIIADGRRVFRTLDPSVRERLSSKRFRYVSNYYRHSLPMELLNKLQPSHKSWRQVFETDDPSRLEALCREQDFEFEWHSPDKNWVRITQTRPAVTTHPDTGDQVWFCQPHLYDFNPRLLGWWRWLGAKALYARKHMRLHEVFHADGSKIARGDLYHLLDVLDACTVSFPWRRGDVLWLDNVLSMHGRAPFTGKRRVLAAMTG